MMLLLLVMMGSCVSEEERRLHQAESCMESDPDFAYRCLQRMNAASGLTDEQRARHALLTVQAMHKCDREIADDSLINTAVDYYQRAGDRHLLAKALLYKGLVHKLHGEVEQAVEAFAASEQSFTGVEDDRYKALLFDHYAMMLAKQAMYRQALHYFKLTMEHELRGDSAHYVVSTYRRMALMYDALGHTDSARTCYEEGLAYATDKGVQSRNHCLLLQNYASFLTERGDYGEAERLLLACARQMTDSVAVHTACSALATLYYEKGEYDTALAYAHRVVESDDSLTACGGYLRLYNIHRALGNMEQAVHFHDLYRLYDNDLTQRRKTAQVAAIPHRVENRALKAENRAWRTRQVVWTVGTVLLLLAAAAVFLCMRKRHRKQQQESRQQLRGVEQTLAETEQLLGETAANLGGLKGVVTKQTHAFNRLKEEQQSLKEEHKEEIKRLKESIRQLETDIRTMKEEDRTQRQAENEQKQTLKELKRDLKTQTDRLAVVEHQWEIDQRLNHFVMTGQDAVAVDLLLQLRYGKEHARYDIRTSEYLPLLKSLLAQESPTLHTRLENNPMDWKKQTLCCLIALGLDDAEMMQRASCLAPNSIRVYRKECQRMME